MDQFEMYQQVVVAFWDLMYGGFQATLLISAIMIVVNTIGEYLGDDPIDLRKFREAGDIVMDRITVPLRTRAGPVEVLSKRNNVANALIIGGATVVVVTTFQLVTISLATGVSVASASLIGSTYSPIQASIYIIAFSMLLALAIFTHANARIQEGCRYT